MWRRQLSIHSGTAEKWLGEGLAGPEPRDRMLHFGGSEDAGRDQGQESDGRVVKGRGGRDSGTT